MINILITTLLELLDLHKEVSTGQADIDSYNESKKRFSKAFNEYLDYRNQSFYDDRRSKISQDRIQMADSINSSIKSTAASVRSITALNSAPPPPSDPNDKEAMTHWLKEYQDWYENQRNSGITIG